jgi:thymidine kinase
MYAGKSTAIYRYVSRAQRSKKNVDVCVPTIDNRSKGQVVTHCGQSLATLNIKPRVVGSSRELYEGIPQGTNLVVIEEAQFFDIDLPLYVSKVLASGLSVVAAGLDLTSEGFPFGPMGHLLCLADEVIKLTAICPCGAEATRTLCLVEKTGAVVVGGSDKYRAACVRCWRNKGQEWQA